MGRHVLQKIPSPIKRNVYSVHGPRAQIDGVGVNQMIRCYSIDILVENKWLPVSISAWNVGLSQLNYLKLGHIILLGWERLLDNFEFHRFQKTPHDE